MYYLDPHIHMVSRTTDDYENLAKMGCVAVSEPAFWPGFDRGSVESFCDYFQQLTQFEPQRARAYNIQHFSWVCINAKEAENVSLSREVLSMLPEFLSQEGVLGIGEIGLNKNTKNEVIVFQEHVEMAMERDEQILIHTPHLADKYAGTRMILDMLASDRRINPQRVLIDHVEEHTISLALDEGYWVGLTLYPVTKCTPDRAVDMVEVYGSDRLMVNSAGDWGPSQPTSVPDFILAMRQRGHSESSIQKIVYDNPLKFFRQSRNFFFLERECDKTAGV